MSKKKQSFNNLTFSYNSHFNYRWLCYITEHYCAVVPSSVQPVSSQLLTVLRGKIVLSTVSIIRHIYSTCHGLYYVRLFVIYESLYNITAKKWLVNALY